MQMFMCFYYGMKFGAKNLLLFKFFFLGVVGDVILSFFFCEELIKGIVELSGK